MNFWNFLGLPSKKDMLEIKQMTLNLDSKFDFFRAHVVEQMTQQKKLTETNLKAIEEKVRLLAEKQTTNIQQLQILVSKTSDKMQYSFDELSKQLIAYNQSNQDTVITAKTTLLSEIQSSAESIQEKNSSTLDFLRAQIIEQLAHKMQYSFDELSKQLIAYNQSNQDTVTTAKSTLLSEIQSSAESIQEKNAYVSNMLDNMHNVIKSKMESVSENMNKHNQLNSMHTTQTLQRFDKIIKELEQQNSANESMVENLKKSMSSITLLTEESHLAGRNTEKSVSLLYEILKHTLLSDVLKDLTKQLHG